MTPLRERERTDHSSSPTSSSWEEAQQRLDSCGTHSYSEETGCLQNTRSSSSSSRAPLLAEHLSSSSSSSVSIAARTLRPFPCQRLCPEPRGKPGLLPIQPFIGQALDEGTSEPFLSRTPGSGFGQPESGSDFDVMWNAADDPKSNCESLASYAAVIHVDADTRAALRGTSVAHSLTTTQTSFSLEAGSAMTVENGSSGSHKGSSSPATLHLPLHSQRQVILSTGGCQLGSGAGRDMNNSLSHTTREERPVDGAQPGTALCSTTRSSTTRTSSGTSQGPCSRPGGLQQGVSLALSGVRYHVGPGGEEVEEGWELLSPGGKDNTPQTRGSLCDPPAAPNGPAPQCRRGDMDAFLRSEGSEEEEGRGDEEQIIEVEGWCHLPRVH